VFDMKQLRILRLLAASALCVGAVTFLAVPAGAAGHDSGTIVITGELDREWVDFIGSSSWSSATQDPVTVSENRLDMRFPADGGDATGTFRFVANDTFDVGSGNGTCTRHHVVDAHFAGTFTASTNTVHGTSSGSSTEAIVRGCRGTGFKSLERFPVRGSWTATLTGDRFVMKSGTDKSALTFTAHATAVGGSAPSPSPSPSSGAGAGTPAGSPPAATTSGGNGAVRTVGLLAVGAIGAAGLVAAAAWGMGAIAKPKYVPLGDQLAADALHDAIQDVEIASRTNPMAEALARQQLVEGLVGPHNTVPLGHGPNPLPDAVQQKITDRAHHLLAQHAAGPPSPPPGDGTGPEEIVQQAITEALLRATPTPTGGQSPEEYAESIRKHRAR
jgi:hypothetical protein